MSGSHVVFFDGDCGVCNGVVAFLLPHARAASLLFAPLQGDTFAGLRSRFPELAGVDSIVLVEDFDEPAKARAKVRGAALLGVLERLSGWWAIPRAVLACLPARILDSLYDRFARNRHRFAKSRESCRLPTAEERALFLP